MKAKWIFLIVVGVIAVIAVLMFGLPMYNVWQQEMSGRAEMAKAEQNRQILVKEAEAKLQAEKLNALAEIERAKGMAQAMEIENGKLTPVYNQYLFIEDSDVNLERFGQGFAPSNDLHTNGGAFARNERRKQVG